MTPVQRLKKGRGSQRAILRADAAFNAYQEWGGEMTKTAFGAEMSKRFTKTKHTVGIHRDKDVYEGIGLLE